MDTEILREAINSASSVARDWFTKHATIKTKEDWGARNGLQDHANGAVYAFFSEDGCCLYVGQTTQKLKVRALAQTARHDRTDWWDKWTSLKFINISDKTDQLVLEMLLIIAFEPEYNVKPASRKINEMFMTKKTS